MTSYYLQENCCSAEFIVESVQSSPSLRQWWNRNISTTILQQTNSWGSFHKKQRAVCAKYVNCYCETALWFIYPQQRIRLVPVLNLPIYLPSSAADCTYFSIIKLLIQTSHGLCGIIQTQITLHLNHPEPLRDRAYAKTFLMVFMHSICTGVISNFQFSVLTEFHVVRCLSGTL